MRINFLVSAETSEIILDGSEKTPEDLSEEIINYLLNLAIDDKTFSENENNFIDKVAKILELDNEKYIHMEIEKYNQMGSRASKID